MKSVLRNVSLNIVLVGLASLAVLAQPAVPPFYEAVAKMAPNGKLGEVIKQEEIKTPIRDARAWRIAYISSDVGDRKTISTALVVAPTGKAPASGRPVMAWAHGTTGTAQSCGPSEVLNPAVPLNQYFLLNGNSWTDYGLPGLETFIEAGYVVVGTDYQGLGGGGGRHQYAVAATQARDVINSVRAVRAMRETHAGSKAIVYGWSQGGGATLAVASLPDYIRQKGTAADGIEFIGFVGLAPDDIAVTLPSGTPDQASADKMLGEVSAQFTNNIFNFAHYAMSLWGTQAAYPNLQLTDVFTDEGVKVVNEILTDKCIHVAADTFNYLYGTGFKDLLRQQPQNTQAWVAALVKGSVNPVKPIAPVVIYWGTKDVDVPPVMGELYQRQMCALGGNVGRVQLPGEQTHYATPGVSEQFYVPWVKDRFAGKALENACPGK